MQISFELDVYFVMLLVGVFTLGYFFYEKFINEKKYYKKVIDNSTNIVMLVKKDEILEVNKTFFDYFKSFKRLEEFSQKHRCICEFFEKEEECLDVNYNEERWVDLLVTNQGVKHKVRINIDGEVYYFLVSASKIDAHKEIVAVIFSDISEQVESKKTLTLLALNDVLTNVGNRRFFDQKLCEHISLSQRYNTDFSLMILDIDYFKKINDKYGHDIGDVVLVEFSRLIKSLLRDGDIFARIGGEEFVILLPLTTKDKAYVLAQKLRERVQESKGATPVTVSIGLVQYEKGDDARLILKRADTVLYEAKETGRNKVILG